MKQTRLKRWTAGMIAAMTLLMTFAPLPAAKKAEAAASSSAVVSAYDLATRGAWNGVYGRDGYVLFGYDGRDADPIENQGETSKEIALYGSDVTVNPAYVKQELGGNIYTVTTGARAWVRADDVSGNGAVLDPPSGSGLVKTNAFISRGTPGSDGDIRQFAFTLEDNEEHLFSVYFAGDMNYKYYTIKDLEGNILVNTFRGMKTLTPPLADAPGLPVGANSLGDQGAYITFKVKGSFVFEVMGAWSEGPSGMFFDPVEPVGPVQGDEALQISVDKSTKGDWIGQYGQDGHILLGYNYPGAVPGDNPIWDTWLFMNPTIHDYVSKPDYLNEFTYNVNGDLWARSSTNEEASLSLPAAAGSPAKHDTYGAGGSPGQFSFVLDDQDWHQFSIYSNAVPQNPVGLSFLDNDGNVMLPNHAITPDTFNGGAYLTYFVKGSFTLKMVKADSDMTFGPQAFFFDEPADYDLAGLTGEYQSPRSAKLSWSGGDAGSIAVIERSAQAEGPFVQAGTTDAAEGTYVDADLGSGGTYYYRLRVKDGGRYSLPGDSVVSVDVPAYQATALQFDSEAYDVARSGSAVELNVTLTAEGVPASGQTIAFNLSGRTVGDYIPAALGTAVTDEDGVATLSFTPDYLGSFTVTATFAADDVDQLANSARDVALSIGGKAWELPPVIYKLSDAVKPGELISINGYGLKAGDTDEIQVVMKAHNGSGSMPALPPADGTQAAIKQYDQRDGYFVVAEFPEQLTAGQYAVWINNGHGWSTPTLLNAARPLFISEYEAWEGQTIDLSGRNLMAEQFGMDSATRLRLANDTRTVEQKIGQYSPYSLQFTVKAPIGTYNVEVSHNDGASWAPLASGQTLDVVEMGRDPLGIGVAWANQFDWDNRYDVTDFGAAPGEGADDTASVTDAIEAAKDSGGGVVYFPAGTYEVSRVPMYADVVLLGEDRDSTHLVYTGAGVNMFESEGDGAVEGRYGVSGFTVGLSDDAKRPDMFFAFGQPWSEAAGNMALRTASEMFIDNIKLDYTLDTGYGQANPDPYAGMRGLAVVIIGKERFIVRDSELSGWSAGITHAYLNEYTTYYNNKLDYAHEGYLQTVANYSFMNGNIVHGRGWEAGLLKDSHGLFARANVHMEGNQVYDVGSDYNDGESYAVDSPGGNFNSGYVINATENTLTTAPLAPYQDYSVMYNTLGVQITDGRGIGQWREVESIDDNVITIKGSWDVIPDGNSVFTLISPNDNVTIYDNFAENTSKGIYIFGNAVDTVVANNDAIDTEGAFVWTALLKQAPALVSATHVAIRDNEFDGVSPKTRTGGILLNTQRYGSEGLYYSVAAYNIELRNNALTGVPSAVPNNLSEAPPESGIVFWSGLKSSDLIADAYSGDATNLIVQNNMLTDYNKGISVTLGDYGVITADNSFHNVTTELFHAGKDRVDGEAENLVQLEGEASVDAGDLQRLYDAELALNRNASSYVSHTWEPYADRLAAAGDVLALSTPRNIDIRNALYDLRSAVAALTAIPASPGEPSQPDNGSGPQQPAEPEEHWPAIGEDVTYTGSYLAPNSKGLLEPDSKLTRGDVADMIYSLYEKPKSKLDTDVLEQFRDVGSLHKHADAIAFCTQLEYVNGYPDNSFKPERLITRAEFISMALKLRSLPNAAGEAPFSDIEGHWAESALNMAYSNGLISGYPDGSFKPNQTLTKAEAATIIARILERSAEWTGDQAFPDLPMSHWAYASLMNAANGQ
ncbi:S-layer homology domain-containing protein [Paenibacillus sp. strain BS8-2]